MDTTEHGSARWMSNDEAHRAGLTEEGGIPLGTIQTDDWHTLRYHGEQHLVTVAPNRTGKGTCAIIPTLLDYQGGVFGIDPKGENAIVTAHVRRQMGQNVQILDPWGIAVPRLNEECGFDGSDPDKPPFERAAFNPLDVLDPDGLDLTDDAMMIADALVMAEAGGDSHWSTEAKAAVQGFILHVVTSPDEDGQRHLPRVRDILSLPPAELIDLIRRMASSNVPAVCGAANRLMQKSEKELQSVMSTAGANTHFLDSRALREALTHSTFDFADLKNDAAKGERPLTVMLVLPADRLTTHGRWLRLLVSTALTAIARRKGKPSISALFILDEFAALGRLKMVEDAFGLMAGFGMRIWAILQDFSQLQDLYPKRWQTFLANAGMLQVFGTNDMQTARYVSDAMGRQTIEVISEYTHKKRTEWTEDMSKSAGFFGRPEEPPRPNYRGMNDSVFGREIMTPEEVMRMDEETALIMISGKYPIKVGKLPYYKNVRFWSWHPDAAGRSFFPLYTRHPDQPPFNPDDPDMSGEADDLTRARFRELFGENETEEEAPQPKRKRWFGMF